MEVDAFAAVGASAVDNVGFDIIAVVVVGVAVGDFDSCIAVPVDYAAAVETVALDLEDDC